MLSIDARAWQSSRPLLQFMAAQSGHAAQSAAAVARGKVHWPGTVLLSHVGQPVRHVAPQPTAVMSTCTKPSGPGSAGGSNSTARCTPRGGQAEAGTPHRGEKS